MSSNSWNDFEHEHAGEGLSPADMSEMYHAEQDAGESGAELNATTDTNDTSGSLIDSDSGFTQTDGASSTNEGAGESEICNENEESAKSSNQWNDFQHEHAGEGLSHADMSEMYDAEQDTGEPNSELDSTAGMNDISETPTDNDSGSTQTVGAHSDDDYGSNNNNQATAESETYNENEEDSKSGNQWNDFQHEHAGEGLSHADMSEMYRAEQKSHNSEDKTTSDTETTETAIDSNDNESTPSSNTSHAVVETDSNATENPDNEIQEPSNNESTNQNNNGSIEGNQWNQFEHEHKNQGLNQQQMAALYHQQQQQQPQQQSQQQTQQEQTTDDPKVVAAESAPNEWNQFEHEHKNQGLNKQQMAALYHQQQQQQPQQQTQQEQTTDDPKVVAAESASNEWTKFEHEHKNQGLNQQQMVALYHEQKQQQQEQITDDPKVVAADSASNEWTKFEHEHKNQGLNQQQMAALYHQQQQQQQQTKNNIREDSVQTAANNRDKSEHEQENLSKQKTSSHNQQKHQMQKPNARILWNLYQHLNCGKHLTKQEMSNNYNQFKENEQTFHWTDDLQLVLTSDGKLKDSDSPAGHEAMKTGLFDEEKCLRRKGDVPYSVFHAKMVAMGVNDQSKISSMYLNKTGSPALHTANLRLRSYKQHAAVETVRRDPDHILELQVVAPELQKVHVDEETFHMIRCVLNSESNIESRGVKFNRHIKGVANRGIARNNIKLTNCTFNQEERQAQQANLLADICHEKGFQDAETVLRRVADKCNSLHSIHDQLMQLNENTTDSKEKHERASHLIESIHQYEEKYGLLNFHGSKLTEYRKKILDEAHCV
jgi:hypothetical protein